MKISNINIKEKKQQKQLLSTLKAIHGVTDAYFDSDELIVCCNHEKNYGILAAIRADGFNIDCDE